MKRFFVFTLIALFVTTCPFLMDLNADKPMDVDSGTVLDNVFVEAYASTSWSASSEVASSHMDGFVMNNGGKAVKYYCDFATNLSNRTWGWPDKTRSYNGWVGIGNRWSGNYNVSFNMSNKKDGLWTIWASTGITVKSDLNGDGDVEDPGEVDGKDAYAYTDFEI